MPPFSCKEISAVLDVAPTKATQSLRPALEKVARLMRFDAGRTMAALAEAAAELDPMSDAELELRERILSGRADTKETRR